MTEEQKKHMSAQAFAASARTLHPMPICTAPLIQYVKVKSTSFTMELVNFPQPSVPPMFWAGQGVVCGREITLEYPVKSNAQRLKN